MLNLLIRKINHNEELLQNNEELQFDALTEIIQDANEEALVYYSSKGYNMNPRNDKFQTPIVSIKEYTPVAFVRKMAELGVNMHAIDIDGCNILAENAAKSKEILLFLMEIGLNPHEEDFSGYTAYDYIFEGDLIQVLEENSLHDETLSYDDCIKKNNFGLALEIIQNKILNLGGLIPILKKLDNISVAMFIDDLYLILLLNKKYEEANMLMKLFVEAEENMEAFVVENEYPLFYYEPAFFFNETETLKNILAVNLERSMGPAHDISNVMAYLMLNLMEGVDSEFLQEMKTRIVEISNYSSTIMGNIAKLLVAENEREEAFFVEELQSLLEKYIASNCTQQAKIVYSYLGWFYLIKKDLIGSEYMFRKVIELVNKKGMLSEFMSPEYIQSHFMIDYIQGLTE